MKRSHAVALAAFVLLAASSLPDAMRPAKGPDVAERAVPSAAPPSSPAESGPLREHADDVADYTLRARLDPAAHTVHGEGTITFRNTSDVPIHELWLHLYLNAFKNERSTFLREPVAGFRGSSALVDWGTIDLTALSLRGVKGDAATDLLPTLEKTPGGETANDDETDARVPLPRTVAPGESLTLDVTWNDKLPNVLERTGYSGSFHFVGQWFPKLARLEPNGAWAHFQFHHLAEFYADFGTYDVTLDVPDGFTVGATGPVVESHHDGGRLVERHVQSDVHDFAWTAWDRFRTRDEDVGHVHVRVLYPAGYEADADRELAAVRFTLPYFESRYGAYPYPVLTVVHPPDTASEAGGMEYPTLITTGGAWYGAPLTRLIELVTVHELGHQYFYGLLASNEELWPFLDEGVNSYAEEDALRAMVGPGSAIGGLGLTISDDAIQAVGSSLAEHSEPVAQPAFAFVTGGHYSGLVYERTAAVLETLRRVYGQEAMDRTMTAYTRAFRFKHPGPEDFLKSFAENMGGEAAAMLRRALFEKGWVDYGVLEVSCHAVAAPRGIFDNDGKRETVAETAPKGGEFEGWVLVERRGTLRFPVIVELRFADGTRTRVPWDGDAQETRIPYRGKAKLTAAIVDPDHAVLLDDDLTNNHGSATPESNGAHRVFERATYWAELLVEEVSP